MAKDSAGQCAYLYNRCSGSGRSLLQCIKLGGEAGCLLHLKPTPGLHEGRRWSRFGSGWRRLRCRLLGSCPGALGPDWAGLLWQQEHLTLHADSTLGTPPMGVVLGVSPETHARRERIGRSACAAGSRPASSRTRAADKERQCAHTCLPRGIIRSGTALVEAAGELLGIAAVALFPSGMVSFGTCSTPYNSGHACYLSRPVHLGSYKILCFAATLCACALPLQGAVQVLQPLHAPAIEAAIAYASARMQSYGNIRMLD